MSGTRYVSLQILFYLFFPLNLTITTPTLTTPTPSSPDNLVNYNVPELGHHLLPV